MVSFELSKEIEKDVFVLSWTWDREKILSSHEESNLRPVDSTLWCPTTEPLGFYDEQGHYECHSLWRLRIFSLSHAYDKMKTSFSGFHFAMCLFSNRSHMTSEYGKNIGDTQGVGNLVLSVFFFLSFSLFFFFPSHYHNVVP